MHHINFVATKLRPCACTRNIFVARNDVYSKLGNPSASLVDLLSLK